MARAPGLRYGGYEYHFVEKAPKKFVCSICTKVARDPHLTVCCGQHFCESCLEKRFKRKGKKSCPHCREKKDFIHVPNKERKREINELKIHCTHRGEGCQWIGELGNLRTHLGPEGGCGYVEVKCPNDCLISGREKGGTTVHVKRKDLPEHLNNKCPLRSYRCEHCGFRDNFKNITGKYYDNTRSSHYDKCPEYPLKCPNECGAEAIKRKVMSAHRDKCPLEPMECPFMEAGCETNLVRRDFDDHMTTQTQQHLLLMFQRMTALSTNYDALRKSHDTLSEEHHTLSEEHHALKESHDTLSEEHHALKESHDTLSEEHHALKRRYLKRCNELKQTGRPQKGLY